VTDVRDRGTRGAPVAFAVASLAAAFLLAACGSGPKRPGGYYKDDGPGAAPPPHVESTPDATPKAEPLHRSANNPYTVFGRQYVPAKALRPYKERGVASWYGRRFHGQLTSSGERYDMYKMTAAHTTLPIPSYARVTNLKNGRSVIVRINDRGPFHSGRIIDLSYAAAAKLGYVSAGSAPVEVEAILPGDTSQAVEPYAPIAAAAAAPAADSIPATADVKGVFLQLGAFSARDNADALRARLASELSWLDRAIDVMPIDGLFRVRVGPYRDRGEADGAAVRIREALDLKAVVIVR
jgi:peptidoglycan lytic transglycosylase